ncbi:VQ motif-containing protein 25-like [Dioscorea cayenensis subsp. rotundata]|uniref:VQ motif-containing protein 25-like n=1 Tax=Dioscorea cayennensis subsp. rotundata TaxID=55577 RepID=A0AB40BH34_DIOCR|nr:VQ motif-containing protein 25-like [Dioscorea cayenensis subsp. rotundata]
MELIMSSKRGSSSRKYKLGLHEDSHMVSKLKPKIRIVHIFAPEIIKTDVNNFRELVQRLTGKPVKKNTSENTRENGIKELKKEEIWRDEIIKSEDFVDGVGDVDEFLQDLSDLPFVSFSSLVS